MTQDYTDKLLDFMYVDRPKVSSLLAQFLSEGLVEEQSTSTTNTKNRSVSIGISTDKILSMLGISAEGSVSNANTTAETLKKNPEWAQAKALVQYVADAQAQTEDMESEVGKLRILTGNLVIYDLTALRKAAQNAKLMDNAGALLAQFPEVFFAKIKEIDQEIEFSEVSRLNNRNVSQINSDIKRLKLKREEAVKVSPMLAALIVEGISEFVRSSPFSVIAVLESEEHHYWFTLKESSLLHDQGDTLLKFGFKVEGDSSVACIVDGAAGNVENPEFKMESLNSQEGTFAYQLAQFLATFSRFVAGRNPGYRSLMPLVVFRQLGTIL